MKLMIVKFDDTVDTTPLPKGTTVDITNGPNTVTGGIVLATSEVLDPDSVVDHTHVIPVGTVPARPSGPPVIP